MYPAIRPYSPQVSSHLRFGKLTPEQFQEKFVEALTQKQWAVAQAYIDAKKVDLNQRDEHQNTLLIKALYTDDIEKADFLLHGGADANLANATEMTPLMVCALKNNKTIIQLLVKKENINLGAVNQDGETALIIATKKLNKDAHEALLKDKLGYQIKQQPDVIAKRDKTGNTALSYLQIHILKELEDTNRCNAQSRYRNLELMAVNLIQAGARDKGAVYLEQLNTWLETKKFPIDEKAEKEDFLRQLIQVFANAGDTPFPDNVKDVKDKIAYVRTREFIEENA